MFRLKESIHVNAPVDRCFLLSTSIPLVREILGLHVAEGKRTGMIVDGDRIVWRGWKFGIPAMHETLITGYQRPEFFQDTMGRGRFRYFQHDHFFKEIDGHTVMWDIVRFSMPLGPIGRQVGRSVVAPHILELMLKRFELIKRIAEGTDWRRYVAEPEPAPHSI